jgi:hypothetical protein
VNAKDELRHEALSDALRHHVTTCGWRDNLTGHSDFRGPTRMERVDVHRQFMSEAGTHTGRKAIRNFIGDRFDNRMPPTGIANTCSAIR